jgi:hypothetical protein
VIDFGCGNGFIISELKKWGVSVTGVEGNSNAIEYMPDNIQSNIIITDVSKSLNFGRYDIVISSEVAEHLPEKAANIFVDNLSSHSKNIIFFTAAEPGQGGTDHINEQPHEYWIEKLNQKGFVLLKNETKGIQKYLQVQWKQSVERPSYLIWNSMIFRRATKNDSNLINRQLTFSKVGLFMSLYLLRYLINARMNTFICAIKSLF